MPAVNEQVEFTPEPLYQFRNQKLARKWLLAGTNNLPDEISVNDLDEP